MKALMPRAGDFTSMWWAEGFPGAIPEASTVRRISTGSYSFALDTKSMRIEELAPVKNGMDYRAFVTGQPSAISKIPAPKLGLSITKNGKRYRCARGGEITRYGGPRLIDSGRFMQRADVTDLVFTAEDGERLNVDARFETVAWPERLGLVLAARPGLAAPKAGEDSFGKTGGGYGLDGSGGLEIPHAPELDSQQFTMEFWLFVPEDFAVIKHGVPWLACKNLNENFPGNFGITLQSGKPFARMNITGGAGGKFEIGAKPGHDLKIKAWNHLAMSYDGDLLKLYVNGRDAGELKIGFERTPGKAPLFFGRRGDTDKDIYRFRGVVDEIRIYERALAAGEIVRRFYNPAAVIAGLVFEKSFRPDGVASEFSPREIWADAKMEVSLTAANAAVNLKSAGGFGNAAGEHWSKVSLGVDPAVFEKVGDGSPISVEAFERKSGAARKVAYDPALLCHIVDLDGAASENAPGETQPGNDNIERLRVVLSNHTDSEKVARLVFEKPKGGISITGVSVMLRDVDGNPTGIPVQISKNWHNDPLGGEYAGIWLRAITRMRLPAGSKTELELVINYAHWGGVAAASHAQLSLIGWGSNQHWSQSALGSWGENLCYEPSQAQGDSSITDARPVMVNAGKDAPKWNWTTNVGGGDFFRLFDTSGKRKVHSAMQTAYLSHGPCLTNVVFAGMLGDGISHSENVSLARTDDIVRGIYRIRLDVENATDFSRFVIFQVGADTYNFTKENKMAYGDETGMLREWQTTPGGDIYRTVPVPLQGRIPWVSLHEAVMGDGAKFGATANRGLVIRSWKAKLGGEECGPWIAEHGTSKRRGDSSTIDIVPPPGITRLEAGDFIEATIEHVIMPQLAAQYYGPNEGLRAALTKHENTWRMIHREAVGNDLDVTVSTGTLEQTKPDIRIQAVGNVVEFTLAHGLAYVPVTFTRLTSHAGYKLEIDGKAFDQSVHGNDFWQTDFDATTATWSRTYNIPSPGVKKCVIRFARSR